MQFATIAVTIGITGKVRISYFPILAKQCIAHLDMSTCGDFTMDKARKIETLKMIRYNACLNSIH